MNSSAMRLAAIGLNELDQLFLAIQRFSRQLREDVMNLDLGLGCRTILEHLGGEQPFVFGELELRPQRRLDG